MPGDKPMTSLKRCKSCDEFHPAQEYQCPNCALQAWVQRLPFWQRLWLAAWIITKGGGKQEE